MSHQDVQNQPAACWLEEVVFGNLLSAIPFRADARWTPQQFVSTAVLWSMGEAKTLTDRFDAARQQALTLFPGPEAAVGASYQAFMKMLAVWSDVLISLLLQWAQRRMAGVPRAFVDACGFVLLGIDGSRIALPRTAENEHALSAGLNPSCRLRGRRRRRARKQAEIPSLWLTTLWHIGLGLPWRWKLGPGNASEREHLRPLLEDLPAHSLIAADAGFAGYDHWQLMLQRGVHFIIRVGEGVHLLHTLGRYERLENRVWLWPERAARQGQSPLMLRLVEIRTADASIWLVTSVLSHQRLSDRMIGEIYRRRWGVEIFYRDFKETLGKRKLLSRTPEHARLELHWSLLSLLLVMLSARLRQQDRPQDRQQDRQPAAIPRKTSTSGVLRVLRRSLRGLYESVKSLHDALQAAVVDNYHRVSKSRRSYPQRKRYKPPGKPHLSHATPLLNALSQNTTIHYLTSYG